ncbi:MAG: hypothetical protein V4590_14415 [Bacteroidota bacterium]
MRYLIKVIGGNADCGVSNAECEEQAMKLVSSRQCNAQLFSREGTKSKVKNDTKWK